jgi:Methyltransferase domain
MIAERVFSVADNRDPKSLASKLRAKRFRRFAELLSGAREPIRILDIGGTPGFWAMHRADLPAKVDITLLNQDFEERPAMDGVRYVVGDARNLDQFADYEFDMCFSNSVIEHVGDRDDQMRMALEVRRVARGYFVQTPNKYFPMEPHFLVPGWQFAPLALRAWLLQRRDWGWMKRVKDPDQAMEAVRSIRLLTARELRVLFPGSSIYCEKIGPLTKSVTAWHGIGTSNDAAN